MYMDNLCSTAWLVKIVLNLVFVVEPLLKTGGEKGKEPPSIKTFIFKFRKSFNTIDDALSVY